MAIGKASDFQIYNEEFFGGMVEVMAQNVEAFNAASLGGIQLVPNIHRGEYEKESYIKKISGLVSRQDITSVSSVTPLAVTQGENVRVKLHRKIGPVAQALKAWKMIDEDPRRFSFVLGEQAAGDAMQDMLDTGLLAARAALVNTTALKNDVTAGATPSISHTNLLDTLAKFGDKASRVVCWVMHSRQFFDLAKQSIVDQIPDIASNVISAYNVQGFNRPFVVTDSASLINSSTYYVLGLAPGGIEIMQSEDQQIESEMVTGLEQLVMRIQGEYAYDVGVKGYTWDVANGAANPDATAIGTGSNWDASQTSDKDRAGVVLVCNAA
jgi:hypothetical protein